MTVKKASFDAIPGVDMGEVKNAVRTTLKELKNRFNSKGSTADIRLESDELIVVAEGDYRVEQMKDILSEKLVKRSAPVKNIHFPGSEKALGSITRQYSDLISGIDKENAKKINTVIKNSGIKAKSRIQEDKIRVTGESQDDLQKVMALLRELDLPTALGLNNYR